MAMFNREEVTEKPDDSFDKIVAIGGDGTILHAAQIAFNKNVPILGVNMGRLGYLTSLEKEEIGNLKEILLEDAICEHILIDVYLNEKLLKTVVNEVSVTRENYNGVVELSAEISEGDTFNYLADGLIVSTPIGSTAYSFSAGGPIIEHTADNILITPLCPHSWGNRSLVLTGNREIKITAASRSKIVLLGDGELLSEISKTDEIKICKSEKTLKIYKKYSGNFYTALKTKLL